MIQEPAPEAVRLSKYLPRKEVISIQPGDVITIKQDNPVEWLSFCVSSQHPHRVTFPQGEFSLEVYREQGKASYEFIGGVLSGQQKELSGEPVHYTQPVGTSEREQTYDRTTTGQGQVVYKYREQVKDD